MYKRYYPSITHVQISIQYGRENNKKETKLTTVPVNVRQDVDGFRRLMRRTGGILVGETATAFFTGSSRGEVHNVDLVLYNANVESCANSWFSFLKGETITPGGRFPAYSFLDQKVCSSYI